MRVFSLRLMLQILFNLKAKLQQRNQIISLSKHNRLYKLRKTMLLERRHNHKQIPFKQLSDCRLQKRKTKREQMLQKTLRKSQQIYRPNLTLLKLLSSLLRSQISLLKKILIVLKQDCPYKNPHKKNKKKINKMRVKKRVLKLIMLFSQETSSLPQVLPP